MSKAKGRGTLVLEEAEDGAGYADGEADDVVRFGAVGDRGERKGVTREEESEHPC